MSIVNTLSLESNRQIKINFDGGDLSSDAGLLLIKEFVSKLGIDKLLGKAFKTNDSALFRYHTDQENLLQMIYMIIANRLQVHALAYNSHTALRWKWQKKIYQSMELHMDAAIDKVQNLAMDVQVYEMEKTRKELYDKSHDGLERVQGEIAPVVAEQKH